ncbi:hypothetical protein [Sphingobium limneticum]|uniref:hypothetical protein n=1 Tax=Sphingobium limneticum TaxID=1007511 RepID=UPI00123CFD9E|nr:hypothetical protein [Sphingobium limneticum]
MAKTSPSRIAVQAAPQSTSRKSHVYVPALIADNFGRLSVLTADTANPFVAKKLDAASQRLQMRAEEKLRRDQRRDYLLAENNLRIEFQEAEQQRRKWGRLIRTKVRPEKVRRQPPKERKRDWPYASRALPKYSGIVLDRRGERGVFVRIRYYSRKTAEAGVSLRVVKYVFNGADVDAAGRPYFVSNVGKDIDEALCAFDHLEQVNWGAQKNAKLMMHAIMAADYRQTPDEMMRTGLVWAEEALGRFNLPYVVTLHAPPEEGDERNWHLHILFSFRPMARTGDHEWQVGEMLRTDLDNPQAMRLMREIYASAMTISSYESGINQPYTAKSNAARGLVHEPQVHLDGMLTSMARNGHHIAKNEENFERVIRSETAQLDEELRHVDEALAREQERARAVARRWAGMPVLPRQIPQRIMATILNVETSMIAMPARPLPEPIVMPTIELPMRAEEMALPLAIASVDKPAKPASLGTIAAPLPSVPASTVTPCAAPSFKIANLRLPLRQAPAVVPLPNMSMPVVAPPVRMPGTLGVVMTPAGIARKRPTLPSALPLRPSLPVTQTPSIPVIHPVARLFDAGPLGLAIECVDGALEAQAKREIERTETEKARQLAVANTAEEDRRRLALARLMAQIIAERRAIEKRDGKRRVEAELLTRHGLEQADIATAEAQAALERIAEDRVREVAQIARIGREAAAALAASASTPQPEDRPKVSAKPAPSRRHPLAAWLHEARRADRIAARDDDDHWPRRGQTEVRPADRKVEAAPSIRPRIMPRELDR